MRRVVWITRSPIVTRGNVTPESRRRDSDVNLRASIRSSATCEQCEAGRDVSDEILCRRGCGRGRGHDKIRRRTIHLILNSQ